jgi:hypothetical protein
MDQRKTIDTGYKKCLCRCFKILTENLSGGLDQRQAAEQYCACRENCLRARNIADGITYTPTR